MLASRFPYALGLTVAMTPACDNRPASQRHGSPSSLRMLTPLASQAPQAPIDPRCRKVAEKLEDLKAKPSLKISWVMKSNTGPENRFYMGTGITPDELRNGLQFKVRGPRSLEGKRIKQTITLSFEGINNCPLSETDQKFFLGAFNALVQTYASEFLNHRSGSVLVPSEDRYWEYTETVEAGEFRIAARYFLDKDSPCLRVPKDTLKDCMETVPPDWIEAENDLPSSMPSIHFLVPNENPADATAYIPPKRPKK